MGRSRIALATLIVGMFLMLAPVAVGASTAATAPSLGTANTSRMSYSQCMYYYGDRNYCCVYSYGAPYNQCWYYWGGDYSSAITPTRTEF